MDTFNANQVLVVYTPAELVKLIERKTTEILSDDVLNGFVAVDGILGEIKNTNYQICYGVSLRDVSGSVMSLDIPKKLFEQNKAFQNKEVRVCGYLKPKVWQGNLSFAVDVTRIEPKIEMSEELQEQEKTLSEFLRTYKRETKLFPDKENYVVSVIHSLSSQVKPDFERQLGGLVNVSMEYLSVNILSIEDIKKAVSSSRGDILAIVRGGGSDGEFEIFNDFKLLEAWANKKAFKISALGHAGHRTYLDVFSDISADTPTAAGAFIKKNIEMLHTLKDYGNLSVKHKKDIDDIHKKLTGDWVKKLDELQKQKDETIKQLNDKLVVAQKEMKEAVETANKQKDSAVKDVLNRLDRKERELNSVYGEQINNLVQQVETLKTHKWVAVGIVILLFLILFFG
jgi:predicted RecB family endonuclease